MRQVLFGATALVILGTAGVASSADGIFLKDESGTCLVWDPSPMDGETVKWTGKCVAGKASGRGVVEWFVKGQPYQRVEGEYAAGKQTSGPGKETQFRNGHVAYTYEGPFLEHHMHGKGVVTYPDGTKHEGQFVKGERHGMFVHTYPDGSTVEGEYIHDQQSDELKERISQRQRTSSKSSGLSRSAAPLMEGVPVDKFKENCQGRGAGSATACGLFQWAKRCEAGSPPDCDNLGKAYLNGMVSPKDQGIAQRLFRAACTQGADARRCSGYGVMFASGAAGISRDEGASEEFFELGCRSDADQCAVVGVLYREGRGVRQDATKAQRYLKAGCDAGSASACRILARR